MPCILMPHDASFMPYPPMCSFGILPTSKMEIMEISNLLKTSFAVGPDELNSSIAKVSMTAVAVPLTRIINSSFSTGQIPSDLK